MRKRQIKKIARRYIRKIIEKRESAIKWWSRSTTPNEKLRPDWDALEKLYNSCRKDKTRLI